MNHHHMSPGSGQSHMQPIMSMHPHSRRQQEYHVYHPQQNAPIHPYASFPQPLYYPHQPQLQYAPQRWQNPYQPQLYMQPPPMQQQPAYQPRSPMVVSSQPFVQALNPLTRQPPTFVPQYQRLPSSSTASHHTTGRQHIQSPEAAPFIPSHVLRKELEMEQSRHKQNSQDQQSQDQQSQDQQSQDQQSQDQHSQDQDSQKVRLESKDEGEREGSVENRSDDYPHKDSKTEPESSEPVEEPETQSSQIGTSEKPGEALIEQVDQHLDSKDAANSPHLDSKKSDDIAATEQEPAEMDSLEKSDGSTAKVEETESGDSHPNTSSSQEGDARRQSDATNPLALPPERKAPFYPSLPWYSAEGGEAAFPSRATRPGRRKRQSLRDSTGLVALPIRRVQDEKVQTSAAEELPSESSTLAAPSEPETPATSHAPSEVESAQVPPATTTTQLPATVAKTTPPAPRHSRRDTRTAIAVPDITILNKLRAPVPIMNKANTPVAGSEDSSKVDAIPENDHGSESLSVQSPPESVEVLKTAPAKPKSWAELVKRNVPAASTTQMANGGVHNAALVVPKTASLGEALNQYGVDSVTELYFLEPRGLINTGNMCYMNSILQILVFCSPFYNLLDQIRQRTVHSLKSSTPLVDALVMFMKEFPVLARAPSKDGLRAALNQQQLEQYGEPVTPEYVYEAIRKLDRFNSMRRGHQQDAEEFLGFLLEGLHDECVVVIQGAVADDQLKEGGVSSPNASTSPSSADGWLEVGPKQKASITRHAGSQDSPSPITKIFGGHLRSELRVPGQKDSVTLEPYKPLQLDIGAPHVNNIVDALKGLTRTESLTGDFGGRTNSAKKQVFIDTLPPVLILHLKRFQYENNLKGTQKIWKKVGYPLELEIPKEVFPPSKRGGLAVKGGLPKYRLTAVVYHHGKSAAGGHYTVDVLRQDGREWVRMDDTVIRRIRPQDVAEGGAEEDPKLLARALEQHKAEQDLQKQRNIYQGLDEAEKEADEEKPWSEVNSHVSNHRKWSSIANSNGTATPTNNTGKQTPLARKDGVRDNKVAYILLYERI